jgi:tetratricopeptide (TPR) repeat protein
MDARRAAAVAFAPCALEEPDLPPASHDQPSPAAALYRTALAALEAGDLAAAAAGGEALVAAGAEGDGFYLLGLVRSGAGDDAAAAPLLERAAAALPERAEIAYNLGIVLRDLGRLDDAMALWRRVLALDPGHGDAWLSLAAATEDGGAPEAALTLYQEALERLPADRGLLYNCADLCHRGHALEQADRLYARVLAVDPGFAAAWLNRGMVLKRLGRFEAAESCYRRALALADPAGRALAEFNLANLLLLQGRWIEGFAAYEARLALPEAPKPEFAAPRWSPAAPPGTLLLWSDQGYGDTIQFLRYTPLLAARGQRVLLYLRDPLRRLAATAPGVEAAFGLSEDPPPAATQLAICSLAAALDLADPGPWPGPYLTAPAAPDLPLGPGKRHRVGLVWAGNPAHINDTNRSLALADLAPLLVRADIEWCSLQTGPHAGDCAGAGAIRDFAPLLTDFAETARILGTCDLVIAVDTAIVHLAGALGRPAWVLLPAIETDWRWGVAGAGSLWYPSLRLFRQGESCDWSPVMAEILTALDEELPHGV